MFYLEPHRQVREKPERNGGGDFTRLLGLRGRKYRAARDEFLRGQDARQRLQELRVRTKKPAQLIVLDAYLYRLREPRFAALMDKCWSPDSVEYPPHGVVGLKARFRGWLLRPLKLPGRQHARIVMDVFGPDAFRITCENLLYGWKEADRRYDLISILVMLQDHRGLVVLQQLALNSEEDPSVRRMALYVLGLMLSGHPWHAHEFKMSPLDSAYEIPRDFDGPSRKPWTL
jgi:hypothetical protein